MNRAITEVAGRRLSLSNLEKDLYPSYGCTKAQILDYYRRMAKFILPHLKDRALTFKRYPEGTDKPFFFEKRCPIHRPSWVKTAIVPEHKGEDITFCLVNDLETLMWAENLASIELHVPLARAGSYETPDFMVFDLDPGDGAGIPDCAGVALTIRDLLSKVQLACYAKTSGKKGLHVYVPLNNSGTTFDDTKKFSKVVAKTIERSYPDLVTSKMAKEYRRGKVFINWSQNDSSKTTVCVYSLRAMDKPTVSFPVQWHELERMSRQGSGAAEGLQILHSEALDRVETEGDQFQEVIIREQKLPNL